MELLIVLVHFLFFGSTESPDFLLTDQLNRLRVSGYIIKEQIGINIYLIK